MIEIQLVKKKFYYHVWGYWRALYAKVTSKILLRWPLEIKGWGR
jgi:hypothetical protein